MIEERVLEVLRLLSCHESFRLLGPCSAVVFDLHARLVRHATQSLYHIRDRERRNNRNYDVKTVFMISPRSRERRVEERPQSLPAVPRRQPFRQLTQQAWRSIVVALERNASRARCASR